MLLILLFAVCVCSQKTTPDRRLVKFQKNRYNENRNIAYNPDLPCLNEYCINNNCSGNDIFLCYGGESKGQCEHDKYDHIACSAQCDLRTCNNIHTIPQSDIDVTVGGQWYTFNPSRAFTAGFNSGDYDNGACNGGDKQAKYMRSPYIRMNSNMIGAYVVGDAIQKRACIYQHT
eukprot:UN26456